MELHVQMNELVERPPIRWVIAFEYYDGPESGLIKLDDEGELRFRSIGESSDRMTRAFHCESLSALLNVDALPEWRPDWKGVIVPRPSPALEVLKREVALASADKQYVALASADFSDFIFRKLTREELQQVAVGRTFLDAFSQAEKLVFRSSP